MDNFHRKYAEVLNYLSGDEISLYINNPDK